MASLEELFPLSASERPLRFDSTATTASELFRQELRRIAREHCDELDGLLANVARAGFQLRQLARRLGEEAERDRGPDPAEPFETIAMIAADLDELLNRCKVRVDDLTGRPWTNEARGAVDLRGHTVCEGLDAPRVAHMEQPAVYRGDRLIARGVAIIDVPRRA